MWFLYTLSWIATVLQVCFVTMAIAAGLYYLAELVEEFTAVAAKVWWRWFSLQTILMYLRVIVFLVSDHTEDVFKQFNVAIALIFLPPLEKLIK